MKRIVYILLLCISMMAICPTSSFSSSFISQIADQISNGQNQSSQTSLIKAEDYFYNFNFYAALMNTGHSLSVENVDEISRLSDGVLYKTIFNKCEILSLVLSADAKEVRSVHCSLAIYMPGSQTYIKDFMTMFMVAVLACGLNDDTGAEIFDYLNGLGSFNIGDSDEITIDGIIFSYEVGNGTGISFKIEKS